MPVLDQATLRRLTLVAAIAALGYACVLLMSFGQPHGWLIGEHGAPRAIEFTGVHAAGVLALDGRAVLAYDWPTHHAMQDAITGAPAAPYNPWGYPPHFLLIAALLGLMPYTATALLWIGVTLSGYAFVASRMIGVRAAGLWVAALPSSFINIMVAHTGFLTGGLFGGALLALPQRPLLAGCLFGLMTIKPQLGLLIPVALIAGGHWRAMIAAAATTVLAVALSVAVFGIAPWIELGPQLGRVAGTIRTGHVDMTMLVTPYGFARDMGLGDTVAITLQCSVTLALATFIFRLWRSGASHDLKAAALISASLLATPYLFVYDLTLLAFVAAFLWRHAGAPGLRPQELGAFAAATLLLMAFASLPISAGFLANILLGSVTCLRAWAFVAPRHTAPTADIATT